MLIFANPPLQVHGVIEPSAHSHTTVRICAEVVFGTPSKNCDGFGVCMLTTRMLTKTYKCPAIPCFLIYEEKKQIVTLELLKTQVAMNDLHHFLQQGALFVMEEPYMISKSLGHSMGIKNRSLIPVGYHPVMQTKLKWKILLPLKEV